MNWRVVATAALVAAFAASQAAAQARPNVILILIYADDLGSTLDRLKLANDTLILFTSDNGPVVDDGLS
jgi:hypothetical protein